jgi:hypothetical protein
MAHTISSRRTTPLQPPWPLACVTTSETDILSALATLASAVEQRWLYADELASVRAFFAGTEAQEFVDAVLAEVHTGRPSEGVRSPC